MSAAARTLLSAAALATAALAAALAGCGSGPESPAWRPGEAAAAGGASAAGGAAIRRESRSGPVTATVSLAPEKPVLGDPLVLTLEVVAEPGVEVHMPAFGEALGRFEISDFAPRRAATDAGGTRETQRYTLEAPMSGRQSVPPLLVEFVDRRPGEDGAVATGTPPVHELLTEEIPVEVASVLPTGTAIAALPPARGALDERWPPPPPGRSTWRTLAVVIGVVLAAGAFVAWRRTRRARARRSAFDVAMARLEALEWRGLPDAATADAWYVSLSDVIRRYIEDRYALRAPELTTEEFLRAVQPRRAPDSQLPAGLSAENGAEEIALAHRALLREFLEGCDRVKFAAYRPGKAESRDALAAARRFLDETRLGAPLVLEAAEGRGAGGEGGGMARGVSGPGADERRRARA